MKKIATLFLCALALLCGIAQAQLPPFGLQIYQVDTSGTFFWGKYYYPAMASSNYMLVYDGTHADTFYGDAGHRVVLHSVPHSRHVHHYDRSRPDSGLNTRLVASRLRSRCLGNVYRWTLSSGGEYVMSDAQAAETTTAAAPAAAPAEGPREIFVHPLPAVDASKQEGAATQEQVEGEAAKTEESAEAAQQERDESGRFKQKEGVQPRIDELTRARREAEREAAYWKQVAQQGTAQPSAEAANKEPTPDQYDDYGKYVKALVKWEATQTLAQQQAEAGTRKVAETRAQTFEERIVDARGRIADFDAVVGRSDVPLSPHVGEILQESEKGADLAYHFAKNPDVLHRLNRMSERAAAMEIGRIEAGMTKSAPAQAAAAPAAPAKKLTNAPVPANTSNAAGRSTTPNLANMSMEEYHAERTRQGARWAR